MANIKDEIPKSVCTFTADEIRYIELTAKSIPYRVDAKRGEILVPPDHFEIASENLHVMHLRNKFKFVIQQTIGAEVIDNSFNPVIRTNPINNVKKSDIVMPSKGEVYIFENERWYIKSSDGKKFGITYLENMKSDSIKDYEEIESLLKSGRLTKEVRK